MEILIQMKEQTQNKRWWKRTFRILPNRLYITISNCRVKKRANNHVATHNFNDNMKEIKSYRYKQQQGKCPSCGQLTDLKEMELHHVLPWCRFPELRARKSNMMLLCHCCHKEIHINPWLNIKMMQAKAAEFGINLKERYNYD